MVRTPTLTALAVALFFLVPSGAAEWKSYGTFEPDSSYDDAGLMWPDAPGTIKDRVYFNAYSKWGLNGADGAYINPNVGAAHTRFDPAGPISWQAILGVWTDCNGDGYVGLAETAAREYSASLLLDSSLCPPRTGSTASWPAGQNNYNNWVTELIPIGNIDTRPQDKRVYRDDAAMVWGDTGTPDREWPQAGTSCQFFPLPGDGRNVGGFVYTLDCRGNDGLAAQFDSLVAGTGLEWGSDPRESASPLNVGFGDDSNDHAIVRAQDCGATPILTTGSEPPGEDTDNIPVLRPVPANPVNTDPSTWTVPGQMNETNEEITVVPSANETQPGSDEGADCDFSNDRGNDFYGQIEGNAVINREDGKRNADWNFFFQTASRGTLPATAVQGGASGAATDFGIDALNAHCGPSGCWQSMWIGGTQTNTPPIFRGSLGDASLDGDETTFADAPRWSFYAYVGSATTSTRGFKTPGGSGVYGSTQCGSFTSGEHHGWNCDPSDWYLLADGTHTTDTTTRPLAIVGQVYTHRDVDCMDGSNDAGVPISPAGFGNNPC